MSDNNDYNCKYSQPITTSQAVELLKGDNDIGVGYHYLNDNWSREEHENRSEAIYWLVEALHWITDGNSDTIQKIVGNSAIFSNWEHRQDFLNAYIADWDSRHDDGQCYSTYNDKRSYTSDDQDNSGSPSTTDPSKDQNVTAQTSRSKKNRTEFRKRNEEHNKLLNGTQ
jgi:hypothetical protein